MKLTKQEGNDLVYGDLEGWKTVKGTTKIIDNSRWTLTKEAVFHHIESDKYYETYWTEGATENQEQDPFEYDDPELVEVELKEVMVSQWMSV